MFGRVSLTPKVIQKTAALTQPEVSKLIRDVRELTALTQAQLAGVLGVAYGTINRWENGHMQPSPLALKQIKALLEEIHDSPTIDLQERSQNLLDQYFPHP
jgi:putative transcriptional regulator